MSDEHSAPLRETLNEHAVGMQVLAGMIEAQRLLIEDLYAHLYNDPASFERHAEQLPHPSQSGAAPGVDEALLEARRNAREAHLRRFVEATEDRIASRHR